MVRAPLVAARHRLRFSLEDVAQRLEVHRSTVYRWENKGDIPQPHHLQQLCELYGKSARELGFHDPLSVGEQATLCEPEEEGILSEFRQRYLPLRFLHHIYTFIDTPARYHELQHLIVLELKDNIMDDLSRRDALRFLASLPIELSGLSALKPVQQRPTEEILTQCAAGIAACWELRRGKDLVFASNAVSTYVPTLKDICTKAPTSQRRTAADLLAQCLLLQSTLARHLDASNTAITYAQQAALYAQQAGNLTLTVLALRTQAAAHCYAANQWGQALKIAEQAKQLVETAKVPIAFIVKSYVYSGLATYQAHIGRKDEAFRSLKQAHTTFFEHPSDEQIPVWVDHNQANLVLNDGMTHFHLGFQKKALTSLAQIRAIPKRSDSIAVEALVAQIMAELSREDSPRDLEWCISLWTQGVKEAQALQSQQRLNEAMQAYAAMQALWPGERRVKSLRDLLAD